MSHALSWFRNRKTAQKLAAVAGVLCLFLAVVGTVRVVQTGKLAANTEHMYHQDLEPLAEIDPDPQRLQPDPHPHAQACVLHPRRGRQAGTGGQDR